MRVGIGYGDEKLEELFVVAGVFLQGFVCVFPRSDGRVLGFDELMMTLVAVFNV